MALYPFVICQPHPRLLKLRERLAYSPLQNRRFILQVRQMLTRPLCMFRRRRLPGIRGACRPQVVVQQCRHLIFPPPSNVHTSPTVRGLGVQWSILNQKPCLNDVFAFESRRFELFLSEVLQQSVTLPIESRYGSRRIVQKCVP